MGSSGHKAKTNRIAIVAFTCVLVFAGGAFFILRAKQRQSAFPTVSASSVQHLTLVHLEPFVLNLADDDHTYLRIGIDLGVHSSEQDAQTDRAAYSVVIARDTILGVLSSRRTQDLVTAEDKQRLKKDLKEALTSRAPELGVREIYFTEFLLQR